MKYPMAYPHVHGGRKFSIQALMDKTLVSVIIPLYNSELYIAETIKSVLAQTWPNVEMIIVDDGSTDNSYAIAKTFEFENIKIFHQENKGASAARNKALQEANGEYIQYLDADDLISPNKIEEQIRVLQNKPGYLCTCPTVFFLENEDHLTKTVVHSWMKQGSDDPVDFLTKLYGGDIIDSNVGGMVAVHSWLCPKNILNTVGPWNERLSMDDDGEYFCRVILASKGILYAKNVTSYYRQYVQHKSISATLTAKGYQSMLDAVDLKYQYLIRISDDKPLINKIFGSIYSQAGVATYPHFKQHSAYAVKRAKLLGNFLPQYKAGPVTNFLAKILGWRLTRRINYYRHGL
jgi:glycosyltransferase involved in cell wall biosynthesis